MISLNDVLLAMSNIPVDDPIAEMWGRGLQGGYRIIEYTGSLPITITANGDALLDYRIYGTDGGVGVRTENLFDNRTRGYYNNDNGKFVNNPATSYWRIPVQKGDIIYANNKDVMGYGCCFYQGEYVPHSRLIPSRFPYTVPDGVDEVTNNYPAGSSAMVTKNQPLPDTYTPYGYKLPMTVSMNYEYVFTGDESFTNSYNRYQHRLRKPAIKNSNGSNTSCSHFPYGNGISTSGTYNIENGLYLYFGVANEFPTIADFKQFLTDQYLAGTPVKLRYFLAPSYFPVYIGENQLDSVEGVSDYVDKSSDKIVRMIGEYTFTGDESFNKYGNSDVFYTSKTIDPVGITTVNTITMRCNHPAFTAIENKDTRYWLNPEADDICCFLPGGRSQVFFRSTSNFTTAAECEAYLKAQYDNGTPVKISYWLKTPVEEDPPVPLPDIPTIDGETVIDYDGTPKPSQMYVKYKGKSGGA